MTKKKIYVKRGLRAAGGISCAIGFCIPVITFLMVHRYTGRPQYSLERKQQHAINRKRLLEEFHAHGISFMTSDGLKLSGLLIEREYAKRVFLICHGYRMCKERMIAFLDLFPHDTVLLFDYRAHGESEGKRTTIGFAEREDVKAALNFLRHDERTRNMPIIGIGVSMGAVSLLGATAQESQVKALILDSPFAQLDRQAKKALMYKYRFSGYPFEDIAQRIYRFLLSCSLDQVDALYWAQQVNIPTMIIHSDQDQVVPIEDARLLFNHLATQEKTFWQLSRSGHARIFDEISEYGQRVEQFLQGIF